MTAERITASREGGVWVVGIGRPERRNDVAEPSFACRVPYAAPDDRTNMFVDSRAYLANIDTVPLPMPGLSRFKTVIRPLDHA